MSPRSVRSLHRVTSLAQLEAIADPNRMEIVDTLAAIGPASAGHLAQQLGRKVTAVHYHLGKLVKVGLAIERGHRGSGPSREILYETPGCPVGVIYDPRRPRVVDLIARCAASSLRRAGRLVERAFRSRAAVTGGPLRDTVSAQYTAWLDDDQLSDLNEHLAEIADLLKPAPPRDGARLFLVTLTHAPLSWRDAR